MWLKSLQKCSQGAEWTGDLWCLLPLFHQTMRALTLVPSADHLAGKLVCELLPPPLAQWKQLLRFLAFAYREAT
jgi:hypothetical protein